MMEKKILLIQFVIIQTQIRFYIFLLSYFFLSLRYSLIFRWRVLSRLDIESIAIALSNKEIRIDTLDLGQTEFGFFLNFLYLY
jgi:hypothetical protein